MASLIGHESLTGTALRQALITSRANRAEAQRQVALIEREIKRRRHVARIGK